MELDAVLAELAAQEGDTIDAGELEGDVARRWSLERGLLAAANLILDVANHVTAGHFAAHAGTYEEALRELSVRGVVEGATHEELRGLGGFRNVIAHEYLDVDLEEVVRWRMRLLEGAPAFIRDVGRWLEGIGD